MSTTPLPSSAEGTGNTHEVKHPPGSGHGSGSDYEGDLPGGVNTAGRGGAVAPRRSARQRSDSLDAIDALVNNWTYEDYIRRKGAAFNKAKAKMASTPATTTTTSVATPQLLPSAAATPLPLPLPSSSNNQLPGLSAALHRHNINNHNNSNSSDIKSGGNGNHRETIPTATDHHHHRHSRRHRHRHRSRSHSRSRSRSRSSSEDEYLADAHSIHYNGYRIRPKDQLHLTMIHRATSMYNDFKEWFNDHRCSVSRNQHEMEVHVAVMDLLMSNTRESNSIAMELICRRMRGLTVADASPGGNNWTVANELNLLERRSLTNEYQTRTINRSITARAAAVAAQATNPNPNPNPHSHHRRGRGGRGGYRGRGRGHYPQHQSSSSSSSGAAPATTGRGNGANTGN